MNHSNSISKTWNYSLPDKALLEEISGHEHQNLQGMVLSQQFMIFQPPFELVVLGQSNQVHSSVYTDLCFEDHVPIMKRPSGGEAVFLSPKMAVVSLSRRGENLPPSRQLFSYSLSKITAALQILGIPDVLHRGISDLAIGERKILGSAIYRRKNLALFHGVLNLAEEPSRISKYLKHPSREPDYRNQRAHEDFVTSIIMEGYAIDFAEFKNTLTQLFFDES